MLDRLTVLGGGVLLLDQITKAWVMRVFPEDTGKAVIPGLFNLVHVRNPGGAFSVFAGASTEVRQLIFIGLTLAIIAALIYAYIKSSRDEVWSRSAYSLVSGGAIGNLIDRVRFGEVIDFLDVYFKSYHWPAFNIADSAISIGVGLLLVTVLRGK